MSVSPSKRRKTSPTTQIAVAFDARETVGRSRHSASSRASYQSPTKASLSRSHATVLALTSERRESEGRGKGLRQEVLFGETNTAGSGHPLDMDAHRTPEQTDNRVISSDALASDRAIEGLSEDFENGLARPADGYFPKRSPLIQRQPSAHNGREMQTRAGQRTTDATSSGTVSALLRTHDVSNRQNANKEPELPPTPIQLGLSPKLGRPRGLAASSSPSSRGSRRSRLRSEQQEMSSPLKSKQKMPAARTEELSRDEMVVGLVEEAPESGLEEPEAGSHMRADKDNSRNDTEMPEAITGKCKVRDDLNNQLVRLQAETARLENALRTEEDTEEGFDHDLLDILSTPNISCDPDFLEAVARPSLTTLKDPVALDVNPLAFLRAFAPGDLRLTTTTKSNCVRTRLFQAHILNISAPPPWPPHIFSATFRVTCDIESKRVISVTSISIQPRHGAGIKELRHWIEARLKNPFHKFDVGTLIWGLGMWWKEAVARAQFFHHIDITKTTKTTEARDPYRSDLAVGADDVQDLFPYIGKSFVELIPAEPYSNRASTNEARKYRQPRLLLKWDLELDWAGEVHTGIDVTGVKVSAPGQEGVREIFAGLMKRNGLDEAVRQTVDICGGGLRAGKKRILK